MPIWVDVPELMDLNVPTNPSSAGNLAIAVSAATEKDGSFSNGVEIRDSENLLKFNGWSMECPRLT